MQRRTFLFYTAMGAISMGTITMTTGCGRHIHTRAKTLEIPDFLSQVCDAATLRQLGDAYRTLTPAEASPEKLIELLKTKPSPQEIKADYANGNIVTIKGWVLSRTEARQCALFSLDSN